MTSMTSMKSPALIIAALACLGLVACAQQPAQAPEFEPEPEPLHTPGTWEAEAPSPKAEAPERPFSSETLYALLAAELAGSRQRFDIALRSEERRVAKVCRAGQSDRASDNHDVS